MGLKELFKFRKKREIQNSDHSTEDNNNFITDLWKQCHNCKEMLYVDDLKNNLNVCNKCDYHFRISSRERIKQLFDENTFVELFHEIKSVDFLNFVDLKSSYSDKLQRASKESGYDEAIICGCGQINSFDIAIAAMEFSFLGGSMGSVVGEKINRLCLYAIDKKIPLIIVSTSGGARMHEGLTSLLQMAKTSAAISKLKENKLLYISILTDPTYGGVSASYAMLGDIIIAEPDAKIGFAGPRVIEETIKQKLPEDFQTAEYLLEHGQIDMVVHRKNLKDIISKLISFHELVEAKI